MPRLTLYDNQFTRIIDTTDLAAAAAWLASWTVELGPRRNSDQPFRLEIWPIDGDPGCPDAAGKWHPVYGQAGPVTLDQAAAFELAAAIMQAAGFGISPADLEEIRDHQTTGVRDLAEPADPGPAPAVPRYGPGTSWGKPDPAEPGPAAPVGFGAELPELGGAGGPRGSSGHGNSFANGPGGSTWAALVRHIGNPASPEGWAWYNRI